MEVGEDECGSNSVVVLVHPFSLLDDWKALLRGIAANLAEKGYRAVTFDMRGAGRSMGKASLTSFSEIKDVIAVCNWVKENLSTHRILLVGLSAGILACLEGYMNIAIEQIEEYVNGQLKNKYDDAFIQGNNGDAFIHGSNGELLCSFGCSSVYQYIQADTSR